MMSRKKMQTSPHASKIFCPLCGHYLMTQSFSGGCVEIKCKDCKHTIILTVDHMKLAIVVAA